MPNVERRTRKKHESVLVISCIILTWIYGKLPKIQILTKKFPDCKIHGSWLKDAFINDQCLHFVSSLLLNIPYSYLISRFLWDGILRSFIFPISMGENDKRSLNFTKALSTSFYFPKKKETELQPFQTNWNKLRLGTYCPRVRNVPKHRGLQRDLIQGGFDIPVTLCMEIDSTSKNVQCWNSTRNLWMRITRNQIMAISRLHKTYSKGFARRQ